MSFRRPSEPFVGIFPGRLGWTTNQEAYPLTSGIPDRLPVIVTRAVQGETHIEIEDEAGNRYELLWWQVQFPETMTFPDSRREFTEWHPRVRDLRQRHLDEYREKLETAVGVSLLDLPKVIAALEWQLERSSKPHPMAGRRVRRNG